MKSERYIFKSLCMLTFATVAISGRCATEQMGDSSSRLPQEVEVRGTRTPMADSSYAQAYNLAKKVREVGEGRVAVGMLLEATHGRAHVEGLKAWLESDSVSMPLAVLPGGVILLVANDVVEHEKGRIWVNRDAGDMRMKALVYVPIVDRTRLTVGEAKRAIDDVRRTVSATTPALMRWALPSKWTFSVCTAPGKTGSGHVVRVLVDGELPRDLAMDSPAKDDGGFAVMCAHLGRESTLSDAARVEPPSEAQLLILN